MMKIYCKPPLLLSEQITHLQNHQFDIPDTPQVRQYLATIGYYRLSAYTISFRHLTSNQQTINFADVLAIYKFDRKLRLIIMDGIEQIEVAIRSYWSYLLSTTTNDAHAYLDNNHFENKWTHQLQLARVTQQLNISKELFIQHYKAQYHTPFLPPIWSMVETLTFGELSKWLANTQNKSLKKHIAKQIGLPTFSILQSLLQSLSLIRNICAHHGRLWNRKIVKGLPKIIKLQTTLLMDKNNHPSRKLYNYLVIITHILQTIDPHTPFKAQLINHIKQLNHQQQCTMGFPQNWQTLAFWH